MASHEAVCIPNAGDDPAHIEISVYYESREPIGPYRFDIAPDTPFSSVIVSDVPVVVQHTRLDSRQAENALLSTTAFAGDQ